MSYLLNKPITPDKKSLAPVKAHDVGLSLDEEQMKELFYDIEQACLKSSTDGPALRNVLQILKLINISQVSIEQIEQIQAEKHLRKLIAHYGCDPFHPQKKQLDQVKLIARNILKSWSDQRRIKLFNESKAKIRKDLEKKLRTIGKSNDVSNQINQEQNQQTFDLLKKKNVNTKESIGKSLSSLKAQGSKRSKSKKGNLPCMINLDHEFEGELQNMKKRILERQSTNMIGKQADTEKSLLDSFPSINRSSVIPNTKRFIKSDNQIEDEFSLPENEEEFEQFLSQIELLQQRQTTKADSLLKFSLQSPMGSPPSVPKFLPSISGTGFEYRDNYRRKLVEIISDKAKDIDVQEILKVKYKKYTDSRFIIQLGIRIETETYRLFKHGKDYYAKIRALFFNLTDKTNCELILALLSEQITPEEFVNCDIRQLASTHLKQQRETASQYGMWNKRTDWAKEVVKNNKDYKGMFKCELCNSDRTGFIQIQIERADEPMTNFVYCYDCQNRYRF